MARMTLEEAAGLTVAEVTNTHAHPFAADVTIGEVQAWFASSSSHRMALIADEDRYLGALVPGDLDPAADPTRPAADVARPGPTVSPRDPAQRAEELALATDARRVPVVDDDGRLLGVVAITSDLQGYCGTGGTDGC
jgi:CBS domain-containing protein